MDSIKDLKKSELQEKCRELDLNPIGVIAELKRRLTVPVSDRTLKENRWNRRKKADETTSVATSKSLPICEDSQQTIYSLETLKQKTKTALKEICHSLKLSRQGNKKDLIERLLLPVSERDLIANRKGSSDDATSTNSLLSEEKCHATGTRTKAKAGKNERLDITKIVDEINNKTSIGLKICTAFIGGEIIAARNPTKKKQKGNRSLYYDYEILVRRINDDSEVIETWEQVEHKGSKQFRSISESEMPWVAGVQFYNGGCEKYEIAIAYAKIWYNEYILSGSLIK
jgi:hypothetical protein